MWGRRNAHPAPHLGDVEELQHAANTIRLQLLKDRVQLAGLGPPEGDFGVGRGVLTRLEGRLRVRLEDVLRKKSRGERGKRVCRMFGKVKQAMAFWPRRLPSWLVRLDMIVSSRDGRSPASERPSGLAKHGDPYRHASPGRPNSCR